MPQASDPLLQWPNLSAHGVTLGTIEVEGGKKSLVFSDETGGFAHIARSMGFSRTRWPGLWVRSDVRLVASAFRAAFPELKIEPRTHEEVAAAINEKIRAHVNAARQQDLFGFEAPSVLPAASSALSAPASARRAGRPRPAAAKRSRSSGPQVQPTARIAAAGDTIVDDLGPGEQVAVEGGDLDDSPAALPLDAIDLTPLSVQATPLGFNRLGETVHEGPDGRRFATFENPDGAVVRRDEQTLYPQAEQAGLFLRGQPEGALDVAAEGLVWAMSHGHIVRVEDFAQFFRAVSGRVLAAEPSSDPDFERVVSSVDRARVRRLSELSSNPDADAFAAALRLHEAAQYYTLIRDSRMTPLPIGVVLQHVAMSMPQGSSVRVANAPRGEFSILSSDYFAQPQEGQRQDILLAAFEGRPLDRAVEAFGTIVSREDHAGALQMLEQMSKDGLGIFLLDGDAVAGRIGPSSRRFLDSLGTHFQVEGMVDVDGALMGVPGAQPKRVVVVGARREAPAPPVLPDALPFVTDYESLWRWGDRIAQAVQKPGSVSLAERGAMATPEAADQLESFQTPYIPTSTLSDPTLMVPRNLASPLRRAMIEIQRTTPHTDEWLASELQMSMDDLRGALSPEQADGVVMAIKRMQSGLGFMVADDTGTGKGRTLASTALYSNHQNEPVIFITEKAELFSDFWRDLENVGAAGRFRNVFVMNEGVEVISPTTEQVVARSAGREEVERVLRTMELPKGVDLVLATYSQFNRDPVKAARNKSDIDLTALTRNQVSAAVQRMVDMERRRDKNKEAPKLINVEAVDVVSNPQLVQTLPLEALKPLWISKVTRGAALILDESHNMSGETSQTAANLLLATMNAKSVVYSSATFARGERNMRAYRRLFPNSVDVEALHSTLSKGGEPLQEALSSMLAEDGALVRREHDLSMLTFSPQLDKARTTQNEAQADALAEILASMAALTREVREYSDALSEDMRAALKAAEAVKGNTRVTSNDLSKIGVVKTTSIGNGLYTSMRAFLTIIKTDLAVERAVAHLREGRKPGLIIEHTMEADLNRAIEKAQRDGQAVETDDGLVIPRPSFRTLLRSMLEDMCKVSLDERELEVKKHPAVAAAVRMVEQKIEAFPDLPLCPLDQVRQGIERAGYTCVELSGRKHDLVDLGDGRALVRKIGKGARQQAKNRFNNGDGDAILLTRAGNAGISLHASPTFLNTQQRTVIEVEVPEDVVVRVQFFGRFNRKDQLSHPIIETLSSDLPAENRVLALQNNKLRRMSANVTANRDNEAVTKDIADIINKVGNEVAFRFLESDPQLATKLDVSMVDLAEKGDDFELTGTRYVTQLFAKMVMLPVAQQRSVIEQVTREFEMEVKELESRGENPLKAKFYDLHARKVGSSPIDVKASAGAAPVAYKSTFDRPVQFTELEYHVNLQAVPRATVLSGIEKGVSALVSALQSDGLEEVARACKKNCQAYVDHVIDRVLSTMEAKMTEALSSRFSSVAEALASSESNMVKVIDWKYNKIVELLPVLMPGAVVSFHDETENRRDTGIVERFWPATPGKELNLGHYWVGLRTPGGSWLREFSLAYLAEKGQVRALEARPSEKTLTAFESPPANSGFTVRRPVLDGNLFRAAELSIQKGEGTQAHYSDEHGMACRAVVLPHGFQPKAFSDLALRVTDPTIAQQFLRQVVSGTLVASAAARKQTSGHDGQGMVLRRVEAGDIEVSVPGSQASQAWLKNNHQLMAVTGPFAGTRRRLYASVSAQQARELVDAIYAAGVTLYAHPTDMVKLVPNPPRHCLQSERSKYWSNSRDWIAQATAAKVEADVALAAQHSAVVDPLADLESAAPRKRRVTV